MLELWGIRAQIARLSRLQELRSEAAAHLRELWKNRAPDPAFPQLVKKRRADLEAWARGDGARR